MLRRVVIPPVRFLWNVPGNKYYRREQDVDVVLQSTEDTRLRGYWLEYDKDGFLVFVSTNSDVDHVSVEETDAPEISFQDSTTELSFDNSHSILRMVAYS